MYMLDQATYTFTPQEDGTLVTIMTGPQVVSLLADLVLVGRSRLSFGLGKVIAALQALEVAL